MPVPGFESRRRVGSRLNGVLPASGDVTWCLGEVGRETLSCYLPLYDALSRL